VSYHEIQIIHLKKVYVYQSKYIQPFVVITVDRKWFWSLVNWLTSFKPCENIIILINFLIIVQLFQGSIEGQKGAVFIHQDSRKKWL